MSYLFTGWHFFSNRPNSWETTTLYSALNVINKPDKKIITVEDPVEYEAVKNNQVQVRTEVGMTFSAAPRSSC